MMLKPSMTAFSLCLVLLQSACATEPKAIPQPPYSVEQLNKFVNQEELAEVKKLSDFQTPLKNGVSIFEMADLMIERKQRTEKSGLQNLNAPGGVFINIRLNDGVDFFTLERDLTRSPSSLSFDESGHVSTLRLDQITPSDIRIINKLPFLKAISTVGNPLKEEKVKPDNFNIKLLLKAWNISYADIENLSSFCQFKALQFIGIDRAKFWDDLNLDACLPELTFLRIGVANGKNIVVKSLPKLEFLRISNSTWQSLTIDGKTLPNLKSVALGDIVIKNGFSQVQLPDDLPQLYLDGSKDDGIQQLNIPKNLQHLDLKNAQLSDYRFIKTAENLRYLNLEGSNFKDWDLLKNFPQLNALSVSHTQLTNAGIQTIATLTHLNYLSIAQTPITDARALSALTEIKFLNAGDTALDFEHFPAMQNTAYVNFPDDRYYESAEYPDAITRMKQTNFVWPQDCFTQNICPTPPWLEF